MSRKKYTNPFFARVGYKNGIYLDVIRKQRFQSMKEAEKKAEEWKYEYKDTKYIVESGHDIIYWR